MRASPLFLCTKAELGFSEIGCPASLAYESSCSNNNKVCLLQVLRLHFVLASFSTKAELGYSEIGCPASLTYESSCSNRIKFGFSFWARLELFQLLSRPVIAGIVQGMLPSILRHLPEISHRTVFIHMAYVGASCAMGIS